MAVIFERGGLTEDLRYPSELMRMMEERTGFSAIKGRNQ